MSRWPVAGPSEYWLIASSPASKKKNTQQFPHSTTNTHKITTHTQDNNNTHGQPTIITHKNILWSWPLSSLWLIEGRTHNFLLCFFFFFKRSKNGHVRPSSPNPSSFAYNFCQRLTFASDYCQLMTSLNIQSQLFIRHGPIPSRPETRPWALAQTDTRYSVGQVTTGQLMWPAGIWCSKEHVMWYCIRQTRCGNDDDFFYLFVLFVQSSYMGP